ncbi:MAG: sugar ABC transporter permease [Defluviitaleaceae bacterium]|nr:sugar ABC transporter permease [Defluviitaleaceae bacterium]
MDKSIKPSATSRKSGKKSLLEREDFLAYLFIAPPVLLITIFLFYPVANVFYHGFQHHNLMRPWVDGFAGFDNFVNIFTNDNVFRSSLVISLQWVVAQVSLQLIFGMIVALLLNNAFRLRGLVRTIMFYPWAISGVLTAMMWNMMYQQHVGVINAILLDFGIIESHIAWLANPDFVLGSVIIAGVWRGIPFFAIMILARLQTISADIYEASDVDGASSIQKFVHITLPHLKESIVLATLLRTVWEFNAVDLIMNLTNGGPARLTTTLTMYIVNTAVTDQNFGYGSALATVSFIILLLFAIIYLKASKFGQEE